MSAEVNEINRWQAVCIECGFWGGEFESQDAADLEADEHDEECHADD